MRVEPANGFAHVIREAPVTHLEPKIRAVPASRHSEKTHLTPAFFKASSKISDCLIGTTTSSSPWNSSVGASSGVT